MAPRTSSIPTPMVPLKYKGLQLDVDVLNNTRKITVRAVMTRDKFADYVELDGDGLPFGVGSDLGVGEDPVHCFLAEFAEAIAHERCQPFIDGDRLCLYELVSGLEADLGVWYDDMDAFMYY